MQLHHNIETVEITAIAVKIFDNKIAGLGKQIVTNQEHPPKFVKNTSAVLSQLQSGQLLMLDGDRGGGLIICKRHYAEFAGPGSAVGGVFDIDCVRTIPVGNVALIYPESSQQKQQAYLKRKEWLKAFQSPLMESVPLKRALLIFQLFEEYFDEQTLDSIPDDALGMLVGVLPQTIVMARQSIQKQARIQKPVNRQAIAR